ncbi:MAG: PqiC family protein [Betaproteobacteria bacterium]
MRRIAHVSALCAIAFLVAGCSTPTSRFYTLSRSVPSAAAPANAPVAATSAISVIVGPVAIPAIVDMPQIVMSTGPNQVTVDEFNRWASPLQNNIARVVAENLVSMLGTPRVSLFQGSLAVEADFRVAIEVQSFDSAPGDAATLNAVWVVRRIKDGKAQTGRTSLREPAGAAGFDALAAAHSRALARMSQDIADVIGKLELS